MNEAMIRKMVCADIRQVRKLPVQLAQPVMHTLWSRKLRALLYDPFYHLLVYQQGIGIAAFAGLKFDGHFMTVDWFATDRFAFKDGLAARLEAHAIELAKEKQSLAILVAGSRLPEKAKDFYKKRGYVLNGNTLIKELWNKGY